MLTLRPYQQEAIDAVKTRWEKGVNRQVIKLPTGTGKTPLFASIPDAINLDGKRMMVLVHRDELAKQAKDKLCKWNPGKSVGIEMGASHSDGEQLVVASVQTIGKGNSKRIEKFNPDDFRVLIVDEAHHCLASTYRRIIDYIGIEDDPDKLLLGVTATINRSDGKPLSEVFDEIVYDMPILTAIEQGWLAEPKGTRLITQTNLAGVHTSFGEFVTSELSHTVNTEARNDAIVRFWINEGENRQSLAFAVDVQHAKDLANAYKRYGIAAEAIWGDDPDRAEKLQFHREGKLKVLVNCALLIEGYDDWRIKCIVMARPTMSELLYTQIIGRGTRIQEGIYNLPDARAKGTEILKEDCLILDVVDNTAKHSLMSLPSLHGFDQELDFKKRNLSDVLHEAEKVKKRRPDVDLSDVRDITSLATFAEQVNLWTVKYPPEVVQFSEFKWRKGSNGSYVLPLLGGEYVGIVPDVLSKWHVVGMVNGNNIDFIEQSLEAAIHEADRLLHELGGRALETLIRREAKWHKGAITDKQLKMCQIFRIPVLPSDNKGSIAEKITLAMERAKKWRAIRR